MPIEGTDFVDTDLRPAGGQSPRPAAPAYPASATTGRAPTREELDGQLTATQQELTRLKEEQDRLEREKSAIEDRRRRRAEFHTGREEMLQSLIRGVGILEQTAENMHRDAAQMDKSLRGLRDSLARIQSLDHNRWTDATWETEVGHALADIENARMEWTMARREWPVLDGKLPSPATDKVKAEQATSLTGLSVGQLAKLGLAFNWPIVVLGVLVLALTIVLATKR